MRRWSVAFASAIALACAPLAVRAQAQPPTQAPARPADRPNLSGDWTLNRELSDDPQQFGADDRGADYRRAGGNGRRGGGFGGGFGGRGGFRGGYGGSPRTQDDLSAEDRARLQDLANEARAPSPSLEISHSGATIAITDAKGRTRFFQTNGAKDKHQLESGTVDSTTHWNGDQLVTEYDLGSGRRVTYTYTVVPTTRQLVIRIRMDGPQSQSGGTRASAVKYVYDARGKS